ncbi:MULTISPECIES: YtpI family protein [Bacillus]|uniref:YtpI family protein n=1 Tax=Bacillus TaxID=1386 RepID=UPI0002E81C51|nr:MULTISPECIES: YtpI family protein [Bacillus]
MPVLVTLIIIALAFYCFYKVRFFRTKLPMEKKWLSSKSSIALGLFVLLFGINQIFLFQTTLTYVISSIFIIIGALSSYTGFKSYKFFLPLAIEEAEQFQKN